MIECYIKLNKQVSICKLFLDTLDSSVISHDRIVNWFKELCLKFANLINLIVQYKAQYFNNFTKELKETLFLYLKQCSTLLAFLINVFVKEKEIMVPLTEARNYCLKQLHWCLDGLEGTLTNKLKPQQSGNFINWMDNSLDKLAEIQESEGRQKIVFNEAKLLIEEVLCHSMSIAQIALPKDCKIIKGSSQTVLNSMGSLLKEIEKPVQNKAMIKLFIDACCDNLCALESKINTAVLRLSLEVFSEYSEALMKIQNFCFNPKNKDKIDKLDSLVADFDLHVDRIMQIGLFAVSVTNPTDRIIKIRSYLASLEGLEAELVPAFTSALKDNSVHNKQFALLLQKHWIEEANNLQRLIFLIIDPLAFCQVIHEENRQITDKLSDALKQRGFNRNLIKPLLNNSNVLKEFLPIAISESEKANSFVDHLPNIKTSVGNFKIVYHELLAACNAFLKDDDEVYGEPAQKILKRCKILMVLIKEIRNGFIQHELKEEKSEVEDTTTPEQNGNFFLNHIIERGNQILKERSILYKSIRSSIDLRLSAIEKISILKGQKNKSIPLNKLIHLKKFSAMTSRNAEQTNDINITNSILEDISKMSQTLNSKG